MQRHNLMLAAMLAALGGLAACSSPSVITTQDGSQIVTADAPEVDEDSGFVHYESGGRDAQINTSEVRSIETVQ